MKRLIGGRPLATKPGNYCPQAGDLIWIDLDRTVGHGQSGRRPAIVLSPHNYNAAAGLCVICPITSRVRDYPFQTLLPDSAGLRQPACHAEPDATIAAGDDRDLAAEIKWFWCHSPIPVSLVMRGLDPRIHPSSKGDGLPGQARQ